MKNQEIVIKCVSIYNGNLIKNTSVLSLLKKYGIYENFIFENTTVRL